MGSWRRVKVRCSARSGCHKAKYDTRRCVFFPTETGSGADTVEERMDKEEETGEQMKCGG